MRIVYPIKAHYFVCQFCRQMVVIWCIRKRDAPFGTSPSLFCFVCVILPDVLRLFRVVIDILGAILHIVHVEETRVVVHHGLEPDIICLVGIHCLTDDNATYAYV